MGNPQHYALELPQRCLSLLEELWPHARGVRDKEEPHLGPLTVTFLLSMSMPIINLPIERIERHRNALEENYADDRYISNEAVEEMDTVISRGLLGNAPFFQPKVWSVFKVRVPPLVNIARGLPDNIAEELGTEQAYCKAAEMNASEWCGILRNALAHGGIAYLNNHGRSSYGEPVRMLAFASGKYADEENHSGRKPLKSIRFLRIRTDDYRDFLRKWVAWLKSTGIAEAAELEAA